MPRVPTYVTPQVRPTSLPGVRQSSNASPALLGGIAAEQQTQAGQGLIGLGSELAKQAIDEQNRANQIRVNDAMNKAVKAKLDLTYNQEVGFTHVRGEAALNRPDGKPLDEEYGTRFDETISTIADSLGNDAQKEAFRQQAAQLGIQFRAGLQQHVAKEYGEYQVSVQQGTIKTAQQQMSLAWEDPAAVGQSVSAIKAAVYEEGRLRGWSAQQVEASTIEQLSRGHTAVLAAAVDGGKLDYAREYFKQNNAAMSPEARLAAQKVLDAGDFEARTQDAADALYAEHKGDPAAALAAARQKYKGKEEDAIVTRIKAYDSERVALRERAQKDAADQAWRIYASGGGLGKIPPSLLAAMDGKDLESLRKTAKADAEAAIAKREVKTDPSVYYALALASGQDPNFANTDLRPFFDKLSPGDRKHFIDLQAKAAKPEEASHVVTVTEQKNTMVKMLQLKDEAAGQFHQVADKALFVAQQEKGKKLSQDEAQKVLDKLVLQGEVASGSWWRPDSNLRMFQAIANGQADKFSPEFSDADRRKAAAALQRQGNKNPTPQQIDITLRALYGIK